MGFADCAASALAGWGGEKSIRRKIMVENEREKRANEAREINLEVAVAPGETYYRRRGGVN